MIALLFLLAAANPKILFIDLNDAPDEVKACMMKAGPNEVTTVNVNTMNRPVIDAQAVEDAIYRMENAGEVIDSIVISGHDGSGKYFGGEHDQNTFTSEQLQDILTRRQKTNASLKTMALWGCYGGNVSASENNWLKAGTNVKFTIGFPIQSPNKNSKPSQELLGQFCDPQKRREAERAADSKEALCQFYKNMPLLRAIGASVSTCNAIATNLYGSKECYTVKELHERCSEFDPEGTQLARFKAFMAGSPGFENPPLDGEDVYAEPGKKEIRRYYDQVNLWLHCAEGLRADFGYDMPPPAQVMRLVKYWQVRGNLNYLNRAEIADYDRRLTALGLQDFTLGDMSAPDCSRWGSGPCSRAEINARIDGAYSRLYRMAEQGVDAPDARSAVVWRMARGLKSALVDLQYRESDEKRRSFVCSHYTLVHANQRDPGKKSQCIRSYEQARRLTDG